MPVSPISPARPARSPGSRRRLYLPRQHGAWAMLVVPFVLGATAAGWRWIHLPLLVAWVLGYLFSQALGQWLTSRRRPRYREPVLVYGALLAAVGAAVVLATPRLLWFAPAFLPLLALNAWYAWRRDSRSVVNDLASVVEACLMVPVAYLAGDGDQPRLPVLLGLVALLYFAGTVPYVKTMIRERGNAGYYHASVAFHVVALLAASFVSPWLALPFAAFLARAAALPRRSLRPLTVGLIEIANSVLLTVVALVVV